MDWTSSETWISLAIVAAVVATVVWVAAWSLSRQSERRRFEKALRRIGEAGTPSKGGRPKGGSPESILDDAIESRWILVDDRTHDDLMRAAILRMSAYVRHHVEGPLRRALREEGEAARAELEVAIGALEDLEFFRREVPGARGRENLTGLVQDAAREYQQDWDVPVRIHAPPGAIPIRVDRESFLDAFYLLLHNAGRFGGGKPVTVEIEEEGGDVRVFVRDAGEGFSPEGLRRGMEPFYTTTKESLGLGLTHARRVVERMEGGIEIANRPGGGGEVRLTFSRSG